MNMVSSLVARDLQTVWHPCAQMKDYEMFKPLEIVKARGSYIELSDGRKVLDAVASWWCKSLGHNHPRLKAALHAQIEKFEHVMLSHMTHEPIVQLSEQLTHLTRTLKKVSYASDGSSVVEMALKMSLHAHLLQGERKRTQFIALENGYHGETTGALSVSDLGIYQDSYKPLLFQTVKIKNLPYVCHQQDPLWQDCSAYWEGIEKELESYARQTAAVIVEPIVQAAAGMRIISQDFFKRLRRWSKQHHIHLIADEIMTGIGRTGRMLACEYADIEPDFLCLSKGLTAGWLPLSALLMTQTIYDQFYDDYAKNKSFLHSHTHTGNALAASVALETLKVIKEEGLCQRAVALGELMYTKMNEIKSNTNKLENIRSIGAIVAADIVCDDPNRRIGFEVYQKAANLGALLRPLGRTLYWVPPLTMSEEEVLELKEITEQALILCP